MPAEQQYSEQSTLRIGESLPKSDQPMSSQQSQRRRRHSGSIPDATTALSMMGGSSGSDRLSYNADEQNTTLRGENHRHRSLSDSRSSNPRNNGRGKLRKSLDKYFRLLINIQLYNAVKMLNYYSFIDDDISPLAPPRNRNRQDAEEVEDSSNPNSQSMQPASNGLPPTPKVHMGACFSKVSKFNLF